MSSEPAPMTYDLRRADLRVKWLVTCLLGTLGLTYAFGALMVNLYAGFTPSRVAATYHGPEMSMAMPPGTTMVTMRAVPIEEFAQPEVHEVDTNLLIQDTHVHVPLYGIIATLLSLVVLGLGRSRTFGVILIVILFSSAWLDFAGMWLTKLVSPHFAIVTLLGGWAMGGGYLVVTGLALHRMWFSAKGASQ